MCGAVRGLFVDEVTTYISLYETYKITYQLNYVAHRLMKIYKTMLKYKQTTVRDITGNEQTREVAGFLQLYRKFVDADPHGEFKLAASQCP